MNTPRVLFVFLDGVGIGTADPAVNPFFRADMPILTSLLSGRLPVIESDSAIVSMVTPAPGASSGDRPQLNPQLLTTFVGTVAPLDATLDTEGTPQSGTGQAALLTGKSTAVSYGRHFGPWTPVRLRPLVEEESVLRRARDAGRSVAFANAYPRGWPGPGGSRRIAGPPLAARGAGVLDRHEEALGAGEAVSSEIVNDGWREHLGHDWLPEITPREAGANLARIASAHDLTLYAHYSTDTAGHRGLMPGAIQALERVDEFLGGLLSMLPQDTLLLIASDHGNIEDVRVGHTRNPALGVIAHARARGGSQPVTDPPGDLRDVTPYILRTLAVDA
jgi:hypothetical protein